MTSFLRRRPVAPAADEPTQPMPTYKLLPQADYEDARQCLRRAQMEARATRYLPGMSAEIDRGLGRVMDALLELSTAMERSLR